MSALPQRPAPVRFSKYKRFLPVSFRVRRRQALPEESPAETIVPSRAQRIFRSRQT